MVPEDAACVPENLNFGGQTLVAVTIETTECLDARWQKFVNGTNINRITHNPFPHTRKYITNGPDAIIIIVTMLIIGRITSQKIGILFAGFVIIVYLYTGETFHLAREIQGEKVVRVKRTTPAGQDDDGAIGSDSGSANLLSNTAFMRLFWPDGVETSDGGGDVRDEELLNLLATSSAKINDDDDVDPMRLNNHDNDTISTSPPTAAPAPTPTIPEELLPKLPETPAFNFTIPESDGCFVNMTGEAKITHYKKQHRLDHLVEILQAGATPFERSRTNDDNDDTNNKNAEPGGGRKVRAICKYLTEGNYLHFPHATQQFTRCFSFFVSMGFDRFDTRIWKRAHGRYREGVNGGLGQIFQSVFGGIIDRYEHKIIEPDSIVVKPLYEPAVQENTPYQGIAFQKEEHAQLMRQRTAEYYNISMEGCQPGKDYPVINILNRGGNSTRSLLNAELVRTYLSKMTDKPVQIGYFEGREFLDQISFMMNTDILISPHGAQLTTVNFMPKCGGVFEVFPKGYWLPHFFGALAASSGLQHSYVYTGYDLEKEWFKGSKKVHVYRHQARKLDVCLPLQTSFKVIGQLVDNWKSCCHEYLKHKS